MLTIDDIKYISFRKSNMRGYKAEDVDVFIDDVQQTVENLIKEKKVLEKKLAVLADQVKKYRDDEDYLKETLLNAQRLAENSLKEARQKHEKIVSEARKTSARIIEEANIEAKKIVSKSNDELEIRKNELYEIKKESVSFRAKLIKMYKEHLKLIDSLPTSDIAKLNSDDKVKSEKKEPEKEIIKEEDKANLVNGSIEKVNEEVNKILRKENKSNLENKAVDSKSDGKNETKSKFSKLKFGSQYDIED